MTGVANHLTPEQNAALDAIKSFLGDESKDAFILRGSAGTGKTTLIAKLVEALQEMNLSCALLAPTGRAARILGNKIIQITGKSDHHASTIHRAIYALTRIEVNEDAVAVNDPGLRMVFPLKEEEPSVSLFVIDESSMVGDKESRGDVMQFGSGRLLQDVLKFARMKRPGRTQKNIARLIFVGDSAQLPPVGEEFSPALSEDYLQQEFGLQVSSFDLKTVMRQAQGSAILDRATVLRDALMAECFNKFSLQPNNSDIEQTDVTGAVGLVVRSLRGRASCVAVVYSNATALEYNRTIREHLWGRADLPIQMGETLLVNRNSGVLNNGDLVKVTQVASSAKRVTVYLKGDHQVDLLFRDVTVAFRDADGSIVQTPCLVLENLLSSPHRELTPLEHRALLVDFRRRHPGLHPTHAEFRSAIRDDPFFNALQVKYGYAMTCHKAQGGEWNTAIVDFASGRGARNASFFRWAYTAITRAAHKLVVVNPPDFTAVSGIVWDRPVDAAVMANRQDQQEANADPDWDRLLFSASTASLMQIHQRLRALWKAQDIEIESLQHLQYCERYTITRHGKIAIVQYYYNKKHAIGRSEVVSNTPSDAQLAGDAIASLTALSAKQGSAGQADEFIQNFLGRVDSVLAGSSVQRVGYRSMPYRLRVSFADANRRGDIDFTYDGMFSWTAAQEVGGAGSSRGLYEEVSALFKGPEEGLL